ncbi:uncharacterized protein FTOL_07225 [Fusarium torulosum]|uniref:Fungal STAND N-terminal Goodbye domain-containing protein n=1 Tax=Fusarium torulosum TaxID=33205 RepID=A0AAE8SIS9_9HYPO|nr:uncharacterized protein FTOL_07225 [Fusarium torulosum]
MVAKTPNGELETQLKSDDRDVADLWKEALKGYQSIVGFDLDRKFDNAKSMLDFGTDQMNNFHKFRHDKGKVDRLRTLFSANLDLIEQGSNQIIAAAAPAFPPAAAIGTALTYMLQACRSVSADYDIIIVFFEDMNSFLTRITILETRLPQHKAYQNCLMEVFTSFLTLCGFAHKYIELGRFKKWISNLFKGDDGELGGARAGLNQRLEHLQQATEFAILGNTEETLAMASQLDENQKSHTEMLERVGHTIDTIHENTESIRGDIAKLLTLFDAQKKERSTEKPQANKPPSANSVRNSMPEIFDDKHEYQTLKETLLPDSCGWVFSEPEWEEWLKMPDGTRPILAITADPGTGKSHIAAAIHDKLSSKAKEDDSQHACVSHFYFREQVEAFAYFLCGVITIINQVAETNFTACEKFNTQIGRDDIDIDTTKWQDLVTHLLGSVFGQESKFHLFIVLDGLDEIVDWEEFEEFVSKFFMDKKLKISLVVTSRPDRLDDLPPDTNLIRIQATKKKQSQDLRALVWNNIKSLDHLKGFSRYVKQRVADKIEEISPNMLYAEHLLVRLNDLGREGSVLRTLEQDMPIDLHGIYEVLLAECQRRMPTKHQEVSASLLHWIAFSRRLLTLAEVESLVKNLAQDNEFDIEEIPELFSRFLIVGGPGYDSEALAKIQAGDATAVQDLKLNGDQGHDKVYDDGPLPVAFKERSMRHYFTKSSQSTSTLKWTPSEANRRILVTSAKLLRSPRSTVDESLLKYCALFFSAHWIYVEMDQHSSEEQIEVLEVVAETLSNKTGLAEMLGKSGISYSNATTSAINQKATEWSKLLNNPEIKANLGDFEIEWWQLAGQDPANCRFGIAKGYLQELYKVKDSNAAFEWWERLRGILRLAGAERLLMDQAATNFPDFSKTSDEYDETKASLGILGLFGEEIKPDAAGHRAVATIHFKNDLMVPAETTCRQALELCRPSDEEWYRASCVLTNILLGREKKKEAYEVSKTATNELRSNEVPPPLKRIVYTTHARVQRKLGLLVPALESYAQAKASDPDGITPGEDLVGELKVVDKKEDKTDYIQMLKGWSLLERITWLASEYVDEGEERHAMFCDIASETGEKDFIVKFYEEATNFLDNIDASPPLRLDLAIIYLEVCRDPEKTLETLDLVFDGHATGYRYPVVGGNALWMIPRALGCMTNVQVELFRRSRDPVYKGERIASLASIMQRSFVLDVPRTSASFTSSQRIALAYMYMVMGPASKFQEIIQSLLDDCFVGLADSVGWNDAPYLWTLAKTLALMSRALRNDDKLRRYARIVGSAMFSQLTKDEKDHLDQAGTIESGDGKEGENAREDSKSGDNGEDCKGQTRNERDEVEVETSDDENDLGPMPNDEGDLVDTAEDHYTCGGFCYPARSFRWWGNRSAYLYVTHVTGMICEECQAEYDAIQRGEKTFKGRYFWGIGHDKLKLPVEGWKGVKDGVLRIEGEEPIAVDAFFEKLQTEVCRDAWERLWAGDAF